LRGEGLPGHVVFQNSCAYAVDCSHKKSPLTF
jgi:hypothetical protein